MNTIAGLYCRRNLVYLHRLALGEISGVRNYAVVPRRSSIIFPIQKNILVRPCVYQYCSSSTTPTPIQPKSPEEVAKATKERPVTAAEREYAFLSKMKSRLPHLKDPNDKEERITEYMIYEATDTEKAAVPMTFQEKVKENTKTAWYTGVMLIGFCVLATLGWAVYNELFNRDSPNNIYASTFKILKKNTEVIDALGQPISCHGEETRPGWRRHVLHVKFTHPDGSQRIRMKFYLKGKFRSATVYLEKMANENGRLDKYNYLYIDLSGYPQRQIHLDPATL